MYISVCKFCLHLHIAHTRTHAGNPSLADNLISVVYWVVSIFLPLALVVWALQVDFVCDGRVFSFLFFLFIYNFQFLFLFF